MKTKTFDNIYEEIIDYKNLEEAFYKVTKGKRKYKTQAVEFEMMLEYNLTKLWRELKTGTYKVGKYTKFKVYEPKERLISAPAFKDKIVQQAVHNVTSKLIYPSFIDGSYACIEGKGHQRAAQALQKDMRIMERLYDNPWVVSVDVSKFFYSIDREIAKKCVAKKIKCKKTLWLYNKIIDSSPELNNKGIPLGCVTSQDLANMTLNEVDKYVVRFLGFRYYTRYMDDINVVVKNKEEAQYLKKEIVLFLRNKLNLHENPKKSHIFPTKNSVNAYGFKIWSTHMKLRNNSKKRMKRKIKALDRKLKSGELNIKEVKAPVNSWLGHARHSNSYNLCKNIFKDYRYIQIEGDEKYGNRRLN